MKDWPLNAGHRSACRLPGAGVVGAVVVVIGQWSLSRPGRFAQAWAGSGIPALIRLVDPFRTCRPLAPAATWLSAATGNHCPRRSAWAREMRNGPQVAEWLETVEIPGERCCTKAGACVSVDPQVVVGRRVIARRLFARPPAGRLRVAATGRAMAPKWPAEAGQVANRRKRPRPRRYNGRQTT